MNRKHRAVSVTIIFAVFFCTLAGASCTGSPAAVGVTTTGSATTTSGPSLPDNLTYLDLKSRAEEQRRRVEYLETEIRRDARSDRATRARKTRLLAAEREKLNGLETLAESEFTRLESLAPKSAA